MIKNLPAHCSLSGNTRGVFGEQGQNESGRTISYFKHLRIYFKWERGKKKKRQWNFWSSTWVHFFFLLLV